MLPLPSGTNNLALSVTFPETDYQVRIAGTRERPEWVAADVCALLEIANPRQLLKRFDADEKGVTTSDTPGGPQQLLTVTEPGLYRLVLKSRKPAAKRFKRWICHEVLPSLRLHGCYPPPAAPASPTAMILRGLLETVERTDRLEQGQQAIVQKLTYVEGKLKDLDGDTGYVTVLAYARLKGMDLPRSEAARHGKALARIHRQRDIKVGQVPDERHGRVNAYRIDVVEAYFGGLGQ